MRERQFLGVRDRKKAFIDKRERATLHSLRYLISTRRDVGVEGPLPRPATTATPMANARMCPNLLKRRQRRRRRLYLLPVR